MSSSPGGLAARSVAALALFVTFHVVMVLCAIGLLYIPYSEWALLGILHVKLLAVCIMGASSFLLQLIPQRPLFLVPGPRVFSDEQPELFRELEEVASSLGQRMPDEVYVTPEATAWVREGRSATVPGWQRRLGVGFPLLRGSSVVEVRAALAHELGRFQEGDVFLGAWLARVRAGLLAGRAAPGNLGWTRSIHRVYGALFLRLTHPLALHRSFAADAAAARVAGPAPVVRALEKAPLLQAVFDGFVAADLRPAASAHLRPPLGEGFERCVRALADSPWAAKVLEDELAVTRVPYVVDLPPLRERLEALRDLEVEEPPADERSAATLLGNAEDIEVALVTRLGGAPARSFEKVSWDEVALRGKLPGWKDLVRWQLPALAGLTPLSLASVEDVAKFGRRFKGLPMIRDVEARRTATQVVGAAIAVALVERGFTLRASPGEIVTLSKDGTTVEPFGVFDDSGSWEKASRAAGIADLDLGTVVPPAPPVQPQAPRELSPAQQKLANRKRKRPGF